MNRMTNAQCEVIRRLQSGERLVWFGHCGPEISGRAFWPQKRTVRAMLRAGLLRWCEVANETQGQCGICELKSAKVRA